MNVSITTSCPYCGEPGELQVDPSGGSTQSYVQDCEVCCQPWEVDVRRDRDGDWLADVRTADE